LYIERVNKNFPTKTVESRGVITNWAGTPLLLTEINTDDVMWKSLNANAKNRQGVINGIICIYLTPNEEIIYVRSGHFQDMFPIFSIILSAFLW
jgi:hypothetical protein